MKKLVAAGKLQKTLRKGSQAAAASFVPLRRRRRSSSMARTAEPNRITAGGNGTGDDSMLPESAAYSNAGAVEPRTTDRNGTEEKNVTKYERWQRLVVPGPRLQYLVSRALLRSTLSWYLDVPSGMWQFETNPYGRPYVSQPNTSCHIQFNLSHTDGLVACGIARDCDIGVDVENTQRDFDFSALMPVVFAPVEAACVARGSAGVRRDRFFCRWTLKEAYIKARGMGLSLPLDGFWFDLDGSSPRIHFTEKCPDDPRRWHFGQYTPTAEHKVAVAASLWESDRAIDMSVRWATPSPSSQRASPSFIYCDAAGAARTATGDSTNP